MKIKIVIILIYLFLAISCKRENDKDEPIVLYQEQESENIFIAEDNIDFNSAVENSDEAAITLNPLASANQSTIIMPENIRPHFLLYEQDKDIVTPEDFEIGALLVFSTKFGDTANNKIYEEFINSFFNELRRGNIPSSLIMEENLFFLSNIFKSYIDRRQIPDSIRIGKVIHTREGLRLGLRMFKGHNRTEGKILLVETRNSFRIKDFYGDLEMLDVEYNRSDEKYEPEIYKF